MSLRIGVDLSVGPFYLHPCARQPFNFHIRPGCKFPGILAERVLAHFGEDIELIGVDNNDVVEEMMVIGTIDTGTYIWEYKASYETLYKQSTVIKTPEDVALTTSNPTSNQYFSSFTSIFTDQVWLCLFSCLVAARLWAFLHKNLDFHKLQSINRKSNLGILISFILAIFLGLYQTGLLSNLLVPRHNFMFTNYAEYKTALAANQFTNATFADVSHNILPEVQAGRVVIVESELAACVHALRFCDSRIVHFTDNPVRIPHFFFYSRNTSDSIIDSIDRRIQRLYGVDDMIYMRYLARMSVNTQCQGHNNHFDLINFESIMGLFIVMTIVYAAIVLCVIVECIWAHLTQQLYVMHAI